MYADPKMLCLEIPEKNNFLRVKWFPVSCLRSYEVVNYSVCEAGVISGYFYLHSPVWCVGLRVKASRAYFDFLMIFSSGISNMVAESVDFKWTGSRISLSLLNKGEDSEDARGRR